MMQQIIAADINIEFVIVSPGITTLTKRILAADYRQLKFFLRRAVNDLLLVVFVQIHKVVAVARHTHYKIAVAFRCVHEIEL